MPVLMAYGYSKEDLEMLVEDCVTLVCLHLDFELMVVIGSGIYFLSTSFCGICY
jgi:hypothetical protein